MNVIEVSDQIKTLPLFKDFEWDEPNETNHYASLGVPTKEVRNQHKDLIKLGGFYSIFIAHMYKGEKDKEFFYGIIYRVSKQRNYRCKSFHDIEYNKVFFSGYTVEEIMNDFKNKTEFYQLK